MNLRCYVSSSSPQQKARTVDFPSICAAGFQVHNFIWHSWHLSVTNGHTFEPPRWPGWLPSGRWCHLGTDGSGTVLTQSEIASQAAISPKQPGARIALLDDVGRGRSLPAWLILGEPRDPTVEP